MESEKLPKFKWNEISERNSGHTPDEWGIQMKKSNPRTFLAYTILLDE